jgi:glyoxylase-like metal-dependent hydrolase (beta-lactamase superfamily II)
MQGTITVTPAGAATIHTYTAPETGWRANSHIIELASQIVLFDAPLTEAYAREVLAVAGALGKPLTRLYISHAHPDHFASAALIDAPSYALAPVKELIDRSGDLRIQRGYACTPGHAGVPLPPSRPVDHAVAPRGEETLDGLRLRFEEIGQAETGAQLAIALPDDGVLITQDVLYNGVHLFLGEHAFDAWQTAITALEALPYETIIPGHGPPGGDGRPAGAASTPGTANT